ncbi:MAG: hypothetical protein ACRDFS_09315 [Chloroflexota bacterium]
MAKERRQSPSTLLWFIRHKSFVPISEIRRRFSLDDVEGTFIDVGRERRIFIGLPEGPARSIERLYLQGKIGVEYSVEFDAEVLIGVYPMSPAREEFGSRNGHAAPITARTEAVNP